MKWACVGDLQIPYQDSRAVALFFKIMKSWKPDAIDLVGDIDDQLEYSSYSDGTTDEFFNQLKKIQRVEDETDEEFVARQNPLPIIKANAKGAAEFYQDIRNAHPLADIHASLGNHDIRVFNYVDKKAPEYKELITPDTLWHLDKLGISWRHYDDPPLERFGGVYVHHGVTTTAAGIGVKSDIDNYNISLIRGHDHRGGVVYKTYPINGNRLVGMGTGHMCDPSAYGLKYTINPSWELGFGIVHVENGEPHPQFIHISPDYTAVVDGKLFKG